MKKLIPVLLLVTFLAFAMSGCVAPRPPEPEPMPTPTPTPMPTPPPKPPKIPPPTSPEEAPPELPEETERQLPPVPLPPVKISPTGFTIEDKPFRFIGANSIYFGFYDEYDFSIEEAIRTAREIGITVIRIYIWEGNAPWGSCHVPCTLEEYDKVLDIAARQGVYVIVTLTDCCCSADWDYVEEYFEGKPTCNITSQSGLESFKRQIESILTRHNTINGKIYRDDTTILAWDIANEPEVWHFENSDVHGWLCEVAAYIKQLDPNHLVTIGIMGNSNVYAVDGPHYDALNVAELDFFSFHYHLAAPYAPETARYFLPAVRSRTEKFLSMGKPVVLEEFGCGSLRQLENEYGPEVDKDLLESWGKAYKDLMDTAFSAGASGVMFWGWGVPETETVPLWWNYEDHDITEKEFCALIREYQIPIGVQP